MLIISKLSKVFLLVTVLSLSMILGWNMAGLTNPAKLNTTDPVTNPQLQYGQELYLENCATCHLALPPGVLPTETWRQLLTDSQHYGVTITPPQDPFRILIWNYLLANSRLLQEKEETPYRLTESRYFKALHPKVKFTEPAKISTCISCHPSAADYNFRDLSLQSQNSP